MQARQQRKKAFLAKIQAKKAGNTGNTGNTRKPLEIDAGLKESQENERWEKIQQKKLLAVLQEKVAKGEDLHTLVPAEQFAFIPALKTETAKITYLHAAVAAFEKEQIIFLLDHGFDIEMFDEKGRTAFTFMMESIQKGLKQVTRYETIPKISLSQWTAQHRARGYNMNEYVHFKYSPPEKKAIVEWKVEYEKNQIDVCILLLKYGAVITPEQEKFIADHLSKEIDLVACQKSLSIRAKIDDFISAGNDINQINDDGETLLTLAVKNEELEEIILLLENNANPNIANVDAKSAIQLMLDKIQEKVILTKIPQNWKDICTWLLRYGAFLDQEHHIRFMTMGVDPIMAAKESSIYAAKAAQRAEKLSEKNNMDQIGLRKDFAGLINYVKEDGLDLRQKFEAMMGVVGHLCEKMEGMQAAINYLQEDNEALRNQLARPQKSALPQRQPSASNLIVYQPNQGITLFDRNAMPPAISHQLQHTGGKRYISQT